MTLQSDMDADRSDVFLDTDEFAVSVTYTTRAGAASTVTVVRIEQIFSIFDNKAACMFHLSAADVASPARGDRITEGSDTWQIVDVQGVDGMHELRCTRMQDTQ
jgi:hypothetical protein